MSAFEDEDGIDGPFDRAMARAMRDDARALVADDHDCQLGACTGPLRRSPAQSHTAHPWPHEVHAPDCAIAWFDVPDQPCRSVNPETCCYCGKELKPPAKPAEEA